MVTSRLVKQGFRYDKLCGSFKKSTRNHATLFRKFGASVKQYMHDGIGLPICIVAALTKHVSHVYILALPIEMYSCVD